MKTVELTNGKIAIPMNIKFYMTKSRMVDVITDLVHRGELDLTENKSKIIEEVRNHLKFQGGTVYGDWYEDTEETEPINRIREKVNPFVKMTFPELCVESELLN